ncbi:MAG TPA: DUF4136 domain-containing protein [Polyangiaceae bacterium]|jgi:hypothetical protein|nr:DUF4136 domain-containing protein [Polyangiaceae bacterium]
MSNTSFKRFTRLFAPVLLVTLVSACEATVSEQAVQTVMSPAAPFARYRTFAFGFADGPPAGSQLSPGSLDVENRLRVLVAGARARKGYVESAGMTDFVVRLGAGMSAAPDVSLERCSVDDYDCVGQWVQRLAVSIDMVDTATGAHVWHGATNVVRVRPQFDDELLGSIVTKAFAQLPGRV